MGVFRAIAQCNLLHLDFGNIWIMFQDLKSLRSSLFIQAVAQTLQATLF